MVSNVKNLNLSSAEWQRIISEDKTEEMGEDDMTAAKYAVLIHKSESRASELLRKRCKAGELERYRVLINGKSGCAYRIKDKK